MLCLQKGLCVARWRAWWAPWWAIAALVWALSIGLALSWSHTTSCRRNGCAVCRARTRTGSCEYALGTATCYSRPALLARTPAARRHSLINGIRAAPCCWAWGTAGTCPLPGGAALKEAPGPGPIGPPAPGTAGTVLSGMKVVCTFAPQAPEPRDWCVPLVSKGFDIAGSSQRLAALGKRGILTSCAQSLGGRDR